MVNESHAERGDGRAGRPCAVGGASAQTLDAASQQALGETLRLLREPALRDAAIATNPGLIGGHHGADTFFTKSDGSRYTAHFAAIKPVMTVISVGRWRLSVEPLYRYASARS